MKKTCQATEQSNCLITFKTAEMGWFQATPKIVIANLALASQNVQTLKASLGGAFKV